MRRKEEKNTIIEICPVRNVIARFGNKWALLVILILSENKVLRFSELKKMIPDVSSRMLSSTLRTLEADGLVSRKVYPEVPPKVEYSLTETGLSLVPFIVQLTEWAQKHMKSIVKHRKEFEAAEEE
jgi:DNA-binding HxlR family transcriptional regulator